MCAKYTKLYGPVLFRSHGLVCLCERTYVCVWVYWVKDSRLWSGWSFPLTASRGWAAIVWGGRPCRSCTARSVRCWRWLGGRGWGEEPAHTHKRTTALSSSKQLFHRTFPTSTLETPPFKKCIPKTYCLNKNTVWCLKINRLSCSVVDIYCCGCTSVVLCIKELPIYQRLT